MSASLGFEHQFVPGQSERTLLLLHGTGGNEHDLLPLGRELDPKAALLSPRGKVLENGNPRFFRRFPDGSFDLEDLQMRTDELADFILAGAEHYGVDRAKMVAVGYSNGANIATGILLRRPDVLRNAVLLRVLAPFQMGSLPDLSGTRIWISGGKQDEIIAPIEAQRLAEILKEAGAQVTAYMADAGHGLTNTELVLVKRWLGK